MRRRVAIVMTSEQIERWVGYGRLVTVNYNHEADQLRIVMDLGYTDRDKDLAWTSGSNAYEVPGSPGPHTMDLPHGVLLIMAGVESTAVPNSEEV